jgi:hypothetical protein
MSKQTENLKDRLAQGNAVYPDKVIAHKDGTFSAWFSFFYRHGQSAQKHAERILVALPEAAIIEAFDDWRAWPTTSYFKVRFSLPKEA